MSKTVLEVQIANFGKVSRVDHDVLVMFNNKQNLSLIYSVLLGAPITWLADR